MFFTKLGAIVAWLALVTGGLRALMGFILAYNGDKALAAHYLGSKTTGAAIDQGILTVTIGIVIGMLVEISRSVAGPRE